MVYGGMNTVTYNADLVKHKYVFLQPCVGMGVLTLISKAISEFLFCLQRDNSACLLLQGILTS